jgi:VIT1/CCC1 family predicted Fe2+/Mn2+ transporter
MNPVFKNIQTEIDAAFLYQKLAEKEKDAAIARVFHQMSEIEKGHAVAFAKNNKIDPASEFSPSWRAKTVHLIGKIFGYEYILGFLLDLEKTLSGSIIAAKKSINKPMTGHEANHVKIIQAVIDKGGTISGTEVTRFEKQHRSVGGNAIRAAVLGGNDGLVSNFSLVMGVAGATSANEGVLLAGLAGLLAGSLSMALGEWISVKSSQELYENQMQVEKEELEMNPEGEEKELSLIYMARGIPEQQAGEMAREVFKDKTYAHEVLVKEELGINTEELEGSAMEAAISSFVLFAVGAFIPVFPFLVFDGSRAIIISVAASGTGLFLIGAAITIYTGRSVWFSGFRQVLFGLAAAAVTFGIGKLIGISVAG